MAESPSSNNNAILIKTMPHAKLTNRENVISLLFLNQSVTVDDANEFIDEPIHQSTHDLAKRNARQRLNQLQNVPIEVTLKV